MNILNNTTNQPSYLLGKIKPFCHFNSSSMISYIYCKACQVIYLDGHEYDEGLLTKVFTETELKTLGSAYIDILEEKEPEKREKLKKQNNSYEYFEIVHSFSESLKQKPEIYFPLLQCGCEHKLEKVFNSSNPLQTFENSDFMKAFARTFNLNDFAVTFLCLNLFNYENHWLFPNGISSEAKLKILLKFCPSADYINEDYLQKVNNKFINLGLFSNDWEISDFVGSYFSGNSYPFELQEILPEFYGDCYSMNSIYNENIDDITIMDKILEQCKSKDKGCYISVSNKDEFRIKNFIAYNNSLKDFNTFEITSKISNFDKQSFIFFLMAVSAQLQRFNISLIAGNFIIHNFMAERNDNNNTIKIFAGPSHNENKRNTSDINYSLFQLIQTQVFVLTNDTNIEETKLLEENLKTVYRWNLKNPSQKEYEQQFSKYLIENRVEENVIETAAKECKRLKISPNKWNDIFNLISVLDSPTEEEIKKLISSNFEIINDKKNIRNNSHYSLQALKTTEPVEKIVEAIKNAEKWEENEYNSDSGIRILNYGLSGTGKTAFVEAIATILDKPLKIIRASDILGMYVGETEKRIKFAFEEAAETNSILLIDEADSFLHGRGDNINRHNDSKVNEFLVQMERFPGILFCNTNLPDNLDSATDRRFHKKIGFNPLDENGISCLCKSYFENYNFTSEQITDIYNSGDVTPGDFGSLYGQLRFFAPEELTSDYICTELKKIVMGKKRSWENKPAIGFGA